MDTNNIDIDARIMITYPEDRSTKDWLAENTGKTGMSGFIRTAVVEKIRREEGKCMDCGEVKVTGKNVFCSKCLKVIK